MKATGIVRRVDDLGRIVIPKEIRRTLRTVRETPLVQHWYQRAASAGRYIVLQFNVWVWL